MFYGAVAKVTAPSQCFCIENSKVSKGNISICREAKYRLDLQQQSPNIDRQGRISTLIVTVDMPHVVRLDIPDLRSGSIYFCFAKIRYMPLLRKSIRYTFLQNIRYVAKATRNKLISEGNISIYHKVKYRLGLRQQSPNIDRRQANIDGFKVDIPRYARLDIFSLRKNSIYCLWQFDMSLALRVFYVRTQYGKQKI